MTKKDPFDILNNEHLGWDGKRALDPTGMLRIQPPVLMSDSLQDINIQTHKGMDFLVKQKKSIVKAMVSKLLDDASNIPAFNIVGKPDRIDIWIGLQALVTATELYKNILVRQLRANPHDMAEFCNQVVDDYKIHDQEIYEQNQESKK